MNDLDDIVMVLLERGQAVIFSLMHSLQEATIDLALSITHTHDRLRAL